MLDFSRRSTRGLAMSSLLVLSLLFGVACDPNAEMADPGQGQVSAPANPDEGTASDADTSGNVEVAANDADLGTEVGLADEADTGSTAAPASTEESLTTTAALPPTPAGLRSVADWEQLFLHIWDVTHNNDWLPRSKSLDSYQFYNLGYGIDGNTAMYRASGKTQYLDRALLYVNNMVNNARVSSSFSKSQYKDSYLGWTSQESGTKGQEVALWESYCWRYVTRLLRVIRETPALYADAKYRGQYDRLLAFTEKNIFEKWYKRGANANIYRSRTHMAAHWAYIAMDLSRMTTDPAKKALYTTVVDNINRHLPNYSSSLRQQMKAASGNPSAWFWSDVWGSSARPGQDVAHGNGVVAYLVEAHDAGVEWTDDDMRKLSTTLNTIVWPATSKFGNYVDGSGGGNGWFTDGFIKLGRYDANLQRRIEAHGVGRTIQFFGNGALNARLLSEAAARAK